MRIFLMTSVPLSPPWDQGDKNLAYSLTRALPHHEFQVITDRNGTRPPGDNLVRLPLYRRRHPSLLEKMGVIWWLLRQPSKQPPDLYHFVYRPYPLSTWMLRRLAAFHRRPTVHTVPATANDEGLGKGLFFADRLVAVSGHGRDQLIAQGLANVSQVPAGIDAAYWKAAAAERGYWKERLGTAGRPVVLFPGHYGPGYGVDIITDALPQLMAAAPGLRLIFACRRRDRQDEARERAVQERMAGQGLDHTILFYNTVSDMRALIGASDVTILPLETMHNKIDIPTTLLESLAAGVPIVISDLPPMNELVCGAPEPVGRLVRPGDSRELADALLNLLQDDEERCRLGLAGQKLVSERYDIRSVARQYEDIYQELTTA